VSRAENPTYDAGLCCYTFDMNSKLLLGGLGIGLAATLAACLSPNTPTGTIDPQIAPDLVVSAAQGLQPRLVGRYFTLNVYDRELDKQIYQKLEPSYDELKFKPNDSAFPGFEKWDVLEVKESWQKSDRNDWLRVSLTRDATVAVLAADKPAWIDGSWKEGVLSDQSTKSFTKAFVKGDIALGAPGDNRKPYTVLFAEQDGKPSAYPGLATNAPAGAALPKPNTACPAWVDNLYVTTGPDGQTYKSWHPQIDPVYWCYFGHEHGSDPSLVGLPGFALEYVARVNGNQAEIHEGFKGIAIRDEEKKIGWYINIHAETHDLHRVCTRKHTVVVIATDLTKSYPDNLLAMVGYKGDFGASRSNRDLAGSNKTIDNVPATSFPNCPSQSAIVNELKDDKGNPMFVKRIRVEDLGDGKLDNGGYENWEGGLTQELGLSVANWFGGTEHPKFKIDIRNPSTTCSNLTCTTTKTNDGNHGDERTFFVPDLRLEYNALIRTKDTSNGGAADGTFYTDVYGEAVKNALDPGAVKQFIKPGIKLEGPNSGFHNEDAWRGLYTKDNKSGVPHIELDNAFGSLN
jgi:hypothetical protein